MSEDNVLLQEGDEFKARYEELVALLLKYDDAYYDGKDHTVTDLEYDRVYREVEQLEIAYPQIKRSDSPTLRPSRSRVAIQFNHERHGLPMLSIKTETDYSPKGVHNFDARVRRALGNTKDPIEYIAEEKFDGLAMNLKYHFGSLVAAVTRGDGETGEDVTSRVKMFIDVLPEPTLFNCPRMEVRGEVIMFHDAFKQMNRELEARGLPPKSNPRNAAAGIIRSFETYDFPIELVFIAYGIGDFDPEEAFTDVINEYMKTQDGVLRFLSKNGFLTSSVSHVTSNLQDLVDYHQEMSADRHGLPYDIDGIVYKVNSRELQAKLGNTAREPRWATAHKFKPEPAVTTLKKINVNVSKFGKLTPVAEIVPVVIDGVTVTKVNLANEFEIRRKDLRIGDEVEVQRAGQTIPEILSRRGQDRETYLPNYWMPKQCPSCSGPITRPKGSPQHFCMNIDCTAQIKARAVHFFSKGHVHVPGLGEETISKIMDVLGMMDPQDFYRLDGMALRVSGVGGPLSPNAVNTNQLDLMKQELGENSVSNIMMRLELSKRVPLECFISALSIANLGPGTAKVMINNLITEGHYPVEDKYHKDFVFSREAVNALVQLYYNHHLSFVRAAALEGRLQQQFDEFYELGFTFIIKP